MLKLENLKKSFGNIVAVKNLNLVVNKGDFFCLLGPSGCGKTSTLRMIAGFDKPTSGKIILNDIDITDLPPNKRNINTVFQSFALFPHLNVYENVAFGLKIKKFPKKEINERVSETLQLVALENRKNFFPSQLSGGQQQRVALARAIVNKPEILLLDEPLGALDEKLREQMQVELSNVQKTLGITFIFVTHNQEEALTMADKVAVMQDGEIEQLGKTEDIYTNPSTRFIAEFIGNMNFLNGSFVNSNNLNYTIKFKDNSTVDFYSTKNINLNVGQFISLALRPEQLKLSRAKPIDDENFIKGVIRNEVFFGDSSRFYIVTETQGILFTTFQNYLSTGANPESFREGEEVFICWNKKSGICYINEN